MKHAILVCIALATAGCTRNDGIVTYEQVIAATYVGDQSCASCHEEIYTSYQTHGMAQSMSYGNEKIFPDTTIGSSLLRYEIRWDSASNSVIQREVQRWYDGTERSIQDTARWAIGSGSAAHTYLSTQNGVAYQLPITRYTQADKWDFSPGYDIGKGRFDRIIPMRCVNCHNGPTARIGEHDGIYRFERLGIGCENCHGPGSRHVDQRLSGATPDDQSIDYTIVNPAHLTVDRQMDICQQCHLQATESVEHTGTGALYNPASPLATHTTYFRAKNDNAFEVISHVERLTASACYAESLTTDNILTCTTCHNPHEGFRDKGAEYFNDTCMSCHGGETIHEQSLFDEQSCIDCHMQKINADDAPHSSFTDHFIRARRDILPSAPESKGGSAIERYYGDADSLIYRAYYQRYKTTGQNHYLELASNTYIEVIDLVEAPENIHVGILALIDSDHAELARTQTKKLIAVSDKAEHLNTFLQVWQNQLQESEVIAIYDEIISRSDNDTRYINNYVRYLIEISRYDQAEKLLDSIINQTTRDYLIYFNRSIIDLSRGHYEQARVNLDLALQRNPMDQDVRNNLSFVLDRLGSSQGAEEVLRQGIELIPRSELLRANLGAKLTNAGRHNEAIDIMAIEHITTANLAANLALAYLNLGNEVEANQWAQRALTIDPQHRLGRQISEAL